MIISPPKSARMSEVFDFDGYDDNDAKERGLRLAALSAHLEDLADLHDEQLTSLLKGATELVRLTRDAHTPDKTTDNQPVLDIEGLTRTLDELEVVIDSLGRT